MLIPAWITDRLPRGVLPRQLLAAVFFLALGAALLPALIFWAGSLLLGRYDGASLAQTYRSILSGLSMGSVASWIVVLGPYALFQLQSGLRVAWRFGAPKD